MKVRARVAGVLGIVAASLVGCAQHATPMDLDVDSSPEGEEALLRHARAQRPSPEPLPRRCAASETPQARPIGSEDGWDRSTLRVQTDDGLRELPLQEATFETLVVGTVAETLVTQVFVNPFETPIEAVYAFPLHEKAAVDDYWIHVGQRSLHGEMHRRGEARTIYEDAKAGGQRAALLEQERPNVFTQSVANIPPGEAIAVQMHVVQPVAQDAGRGTLTLPTVVGPRFIPGTPTGRSGVGEVPDTDEVPDASKITPPVLGARARGCSPLLISVDIESTLPVGSLVSANHAIERTRARGVTTVELAQGRTLANRDFELSWSVAGDTTQAAVMTQVEEGGGGAFTLTLVPPASVETDAAVPRDLIFVVDNSGSMSGKPIDTAKAVMRKAIATMGPRDRFSVLRFSEEASGLSRTLLSNTKENRTRGLAYVEAMRGMGGTRMLEGIKAALALAQDAERVPMVFFLTDGYIGDERAIFELVAEEGGNARIFGFGLGDAPNRYLLDGLSNVGRGAVAYVGNDEPADAAVQRFYQRIARPTLRDVTIDWGTLPVRGVVPERLPDLFVGQPLVLYGTFDTAAEGTVVVQGWRGETRERFEVEVDLASASEGTGLRSMWARTKIEALLRDPLVYRLDTDAQEHRTEQAIELALRHSVLTEHTAFVAVDKDVVTKQSATTVAVPVEPVRGMAQPQSGLSLVGTGRGGGGTGEGTIGLGNTGVIGRGGGGGSGAGYGRGAGAGFGGRGARVPRVRAAKATVTGSLDRDVIRRVVRAHHNPVRACYQTALEKDPNLKFRVVVAFVIDATGKATAALEWKHKPESDALKDFDACMLEAFGRMKFPKPTGGGTVKVTYPFVFEPG